MIDIIVNVDNNKRLLRIITSRFCSISFTKTKIIFIVMKNTHYHCYDSLEDQCGFIMLHNQVTKIEKAVNRNAVLNMHVKRKF